VRARDQKHFPSHFLRGKGEEEYAKKRRGEGRGTEHREDSQTLLFSTVLVVNTTSLNKKQGRKVYSSEVHVFPKRVLCDFYPLMAFVFICYAYKSTLVREYYTKDF
jgi:hypothetical protein